MLWSRFGTVLVRHPRLIAAVLAITSALAVVGLSQLRFDDQPNNAFRADGRDYQRLQEFQRAFGSDDNDVLIILRSDDLFEPDTLGALPAIQNRVRKIDGIESVWGLPDIEVPQGIAGYGMLSVFQTTPLIETPVSAESATDALKAVRANPFLSEHLVSDDESATLLLVHIYDDRTAISELEPIVIALRSELEAATDGNTIEFIIAGIPPLRVEIFNAIRRENVMFLGLGVVLAWVCAWLLFRQWKLVLLVSGGPVLGMLWTLGGMGLVGASINVINVVLPALVIVIGLTNSIHLMTDIRRSLEDGNSGSDAAALAVAHLGGSCSLAALTTAIGFSSLTISDIESIRGFGLVCAAGSGFAFLANILLLPWLSRIWLTPDDCKRHPGVIGRWERPLMWIDRLTTRFAAPISFAGLLLLTGLILLVPQLRPDTWLREASPPQWESHRAVVAADELFGGATSTSVIVRWDESIDAASPEVINALKAAEDVIEGDPQLRHPFSILDPMRMYLGPDLKLLNQLPEGFRSGLEESAKQSDNDMLGRFVNLNQRKARVMVRLRDLGAAAYEPIFTRLETELARIEGNHPGIRFELTGTTVVIARNVGQMIRDLGSSLAIASATIFLVITIAFRSLKIGLVSLVPNAFPLLFACGVLVCFGLPLQLSSVMVFSICLGIAVDDTIHLLNRYRRERAADSVTASDALTRSIQLVGPALMNSTLVLMAGFGSLLASEMPPTRIFSWLSCIAILAALFGDLVLLPAVIRAVRGLLVESETSDQSST